MLVWIWGFGAEAFIIRKLSFDGKKINLMSIKAQNINPMSADLFCVVIGGENIYDSQILWKKAQIYL